MGHYIPILCQVCYLDHYLEYKGYHCQHKMDYCTVKTKCVVTILGGIDLLTAQLEESHTQGPAMPMQLSTLTLLISDCPLESDELVVEESDSQVQISGNNIKVKA